MLLIGGWVVGCINIMVPSFHETSNPKQNGSLLVHTSR
jgi:hypothetical protein